jgi:hypothetical protein
LARLRGMESEKYIAAGKEKEKEKGMPSHRKV